MPLIKDKVNYTSLFVSTLQTLRCGIELEGNVGNKHCHGDIYNDPCEHCRAPSCNGCEYKDGYDNTNTVLKLIASKAKCSPSRNLIKDIRLCGNFLYAYNDGSTDVELVTNSVPLHKFGDLVKQGLSILKSCNVVVDPSASAGAHQTFSAEEPFDHIVISNIVQVVRLTLPALISVGCVINTSKRDSGYRSMPHNRDAYLKDSKATAISYKLLSANTSLVEFRYPDGHNNVKQHELVALINAAIILKSIELSIGGKVFDPDVGDNGRISDKIYDEGFNFSVIPKIRENRKVLLDFVERGIKLLTFNHEEIFDTISDFPIPIKNGEDIDLTIEWMKYIG